MNDCEITRTMLSVHNIEADRRSGNQTLSLWERVARSAG